MYTFSSIGLSDSSAGKESPARQESLALFLGAGRFPAEANGHRQYSGLENSVISLIHILPYLFCQCIFVFCFIHITTHNVFTVLQLAFFTNSVS